MDPMSKDAVNIKVIPLAAELGYGETIRVHASAKDYTGHLRKSIPVAAPYAGHNFGHTTWQGSACSSFTASSPRGVSTCLVITSQMDDGNLYPMQSAPVEAYGFNHFITARVTNADGSTVSDKMYFVVFPKGEDPLVKWSGDGQHGVPYGISEQIVVKTNAWDPRSGWTGAPGRKVVFRVLDPVQAKPSNFQNAQLSKRHTWTVAPFDYPGIWPLLGDDGRDAVNELTVYTDSYGYASARFYFGNTDNMDYRIEARLPEEAGQVVVFTVHVDPVIIHSSYPPPSTWLFSEVIKEPETALEGSDLPVRVHVKKFSALDSILCADPLGTCPVKMEPKVDFPVNIYKQIDSGPKGLYATATTDGDGVAEVVYTVPDLGASQASFYIYNIGWELMRQIKSVKAESITFDLKRLTASNQRASLLLGNDVPGHDRAVIISIYNPTSYFLLLNVLELPQNGGDLVVLKGISDPRIRDSLIVFPGNGEYVLELARPPAKGTVEFQILEMDTWSVLKSSHFHVSGCCQSGNCPDCARGFWSGITGSFNIEVNFPATPLSAGIAFAEGWLSCWGCSEEVNIKAWCWPVGVGATEGIMNIPLPTGSLGVDSIFCWGAHCEEDLEGWTKGVMVQIGAIGPVGGAGSFEIGSSSCVSVGLGVGAGNWGGYKYCKYEVNP